MNLKLSILTLIFALISIACNHDSGKNNNDKGSLVGTDVIVMSQFPNVPGKIFGSWKANLPDGSKIYYFFNQQNIGIRHICKASDDSEIKLEGVSSVTLFDNRVFVLHDLELLGQEDCNYKMPAGNLQISGFGGNTMWIARDDNQIPMMQLFRYSPTKIRSEP